ncbi:hypothetical protein [Candidatus Lokiarchaeum ossiferum]|uniref:hypothetical protein n=1 Tax=Candidatus Lokiarchaeum ossiferum TaxID=2951803 RepID=UPI00352ECC94
MVLNLYKITEDEILSVDTVSPEDIILISNSDNKRLYLYRGPYSLSYNQFQSDILYERIVNRFLNPNIFVLSNLISEDPTSELNSVKKFIQEHYQNLGAYKFKHLLKNIFLLQGIRNRVLLFKNFENSHPYRSRISNTSKMWRFGLMNLLLSGLLIVIMVLTLVVGLIPEIAGSTSSESGSFWLENLAFIFGITIIVLTIVFIVNLSFVINPLKFPIKPDALESMLKKEGIKKMEEKHTRPKKIEQ